MAFDLTAISQAVADHGSVARIAITSARGSVPRDAGTSMLVLADGSHIGTIGGGTLEYQAIEFARKILPGSDMWKRDHRQVPLGPALGQCCGGTVSILTEIFRPEEITALENLPETTQSYTRPITSGAAPDQSIPVKMAERRNRAEATGSADSTILMAGWFSEPFSEPRHPLWIYGAGHVGRALVNILPPLGFDVTWIDTDPARFPDTIPERSTQLVAKNPGDVVRFAPTNARHLVLTYSHALDLDLCHRILSRPFLSAGLIGSATKWARFRNRLERLGHTRQQINRIVCPIGQPELGKSPEVIAVGVATELLRNNAIGLASTDISKEFAL